MDKKYKDVHIINKKTKEIICTIREVRLVRIMDCCVRVWLDSTNEITIPLIDIEKVNILID